jgi:hypothetical protein
VINGIDKQLIFIRTISLILCVSIFAIIVLKIVSPSSVDGKNIETIFGLIKDMTFIIVGYLFGKKEDNDK